MSEPAPQSSPGGPPPRTPQGVPDATPAVSDLHQVVVNDEGQYSLWPLNSQPPAGWRAEGITGTRQECLDHIDQAWTDMRPRSVREQLADGAAR